MLFLGLYHNLTMTHLMMLKVCILLLFFAGVGVALHSHAKRPSSGTCNHNTKVLSQSENMGSTAKVQHNTYMTFFRGSFSNVLARKLYLKLGYPS